VTPLTLDCTVVQQQLGAYRDGELSAEAGQRVGAHLEGCETCAGELARLEAALGALKSLSGRDVDRLRAEAAPFDPRPLTTLLGLGAVLLIGALIALVVLAFRDTPPPEAAPPAPRAPAPVGPAIVLPSVGAVVGIEEDLDWIPTARLTDPLALPAEAQPVDVVAAPVEQEQAPEPIAKVEPQPEPKPVAVAPKPKKQPKKKPELLPLPASVAKAMARWKVANGIGYKGLELYFVQDATARDKLGAGSLALTRPKEVNPPRPDLITLKPPRAVRGYVWLAGELVEAPYGLRVLSRSAQLASGELEVLPLSFDGLTRRQTPILKSPLLLPSVARKELAQGRGQQSLAELLQLLNDPSLLEFRRLRDELARLESDARELERRLRGVLSRERGLRGLGYSIGTKARALDLFPDAASLGAALPRLLRTALLEEALESAAERMPVDELTDSRPRTLVPGVQTSRKAHVALLKLAREAKAPPGDERYTARAKGAVSEVRIRRDALIHAASLQ